jgi:uncharacterized protein
MEASAATDDLCQSCGACCSYSANWPRFTIEDDAALDRCSALTGSVGAATSCAIYALRPEVCRTCLPGDAECNMARRRHGLPAIEA